MRLIINNILQNRQFDSYRNYPLFYAYRLLGAVPSNVHSERTSIIYATPCVLGVSNPHGNHFDGMAVAPMCSKQQPAQAVAFSGDERELLLLSRGRAQLYPSSM